MQSLSPLCHLVFARVHVKGNDYGCGDDDGDVGGYDCVGSASASGYDFVEGDVTVSD